MIKVIITGVECSGKSTLAKSIHESRESILITEYSRIYLNQLNRSYRYEVLLIFAKHQVKQELEAALSNPPLLLCDTSLLVLKIWSLIRFGKCDSWILHALDHLTCDLFLLPYWDIPYENDPLRENPNDREYLFQLYHQELDALQKPYQILYGDPSERLNKANHLIDQLMSNDGSHFV